MPFANWRGRCTAVLAGWVVLIAVVFGTLPPGRHVRADQVALDQPSVVRGSVMVAGGADIVGGRSGRPMVITASYEATSSVGIVVELRTVGDYGGNCRGQSFLESAAWTSMAPTMAFTIPYLAPNLIGFYVTGQVRDDRGNLSPVFCDDVTVEGNGRPPTPTRTPTPVPPDSYLPWLGGRPDS